MILKFSATGRPLWGKVWGSAGAFDDSVDDVVLGPTGEVYVAVNVHTASWGHGAVLNYSAGGQLHWSDSDADKEPTPALKYIRTIAVDAGDRVRILLYTPQGTPPVEVRMYGAEGALRWQRPLPLVASDRAAGGAMWVTGSGRTYITGLVDWLDAREGRLFVTALKAGGTAPCGQGTGRGPRVRPPAVPSSHCATAGCTPPASPTAAPPATTSSHCASCRDRGQEDDGRRRAPNGCAAGREEEDRP